MAFFDELGKKISQTTQDVVQKTKDTTETMKLNNMISDEEKLIKSLYTEIGKVYFELYSENCDNCDETLKKYIGDIKDSKTKIQKYSEQVKRLKGIKPCPNCGADVQPNAPVCNACGFRLIAPPPQPVANTVPHCTGCGSPLNPGSAFCTKCGKKVEPIAPVQPTPPAPPAQPAAPVVPEQPAAPTAPVAPVAPTPAAKVCANCGKELTSGMKFCTGCGTPVEN